ncbi:hypothetical protein PAPHI01_2102 [Pancytospora philotis]|nr:hypothetical protein PAPHI01_2102 [Pancytospora philotis]
MSKFNFIFIAVDFEVQPWSEGWLYVMTWDGVMTKCHRKYVSELSIFPNVEACIQSRVLQRTVESVSFDARRDILEEGDGRGLS